MKYVHISEWQELVAGGVICAWTPQIYTKFYIVCEAGRRGVDGSVLKVQVHLQKILDTITVGTSCESVYCVHEFVHWFTKQWDTDYSYLLSA